MGFHTQTATDTATRMVQATIIKPRTIVMQLGDEDFSHLAKVAAADKQQVLVAIGRFAAYAVHGDYDKVLIYRNRDDLEAYFTDNDGPRRLVMGAVWGCHNNMFSYHT